MHLPPRVARTVLRGATAAATLAISSAFLPLPAAPTARFAEPAAQDAGEEAPSPEPMLDKLAEGLKERRTPKEDERDAADGKIVAAIDELLQAYPRFDEKGQRSAVNGLAKLLSTRFEEDQNRVYIAAAAALSEMGDGGADAIMKAFKLKHIEKRLEVKEVLIEALGKHRNPKHVEFFVKQLGDGEARITAAATKALSEYRDADAKVRKEIVEELIKQYANTTNLDLREKGKNPVWRERLQTIEVPMNDALSALTLQNFRSAPEWEAWFNDNRNKKW